MNIDVLLFASYADALGAPSVQVVVAEGSTVGEVLTEVSRRAGGAVLPSSPLVAVNERYARMSTQLAGGDVLAIIPPVAGG